MKRVMIFSPHPDDETFACGGTIAWKLSDGYDVSVVFITDGRHCLSDIGTFEPTPLEIREIRREEAFKAARILGIREDNLLLLDFEDGMLERRTEQFLQKTVEILRDVVPEEVFFPQEREYNVDHRVTNRVVRKALAVLNIHPVQYQYTIAWAFPFYLLAHVINEPTFDRMMAKLSKTCLIRVNISRFFTLKVMAMNKYRSQINLISPNQARPALKPSFVSRFSEDEERFFVNPRTIKA